MTSSTSSAGRALPLELIEEIFREDVLDKSDFSSLSRVSRQFCDLARPQLFFRQTIECRIKLKVWGRTTTSLTKYGV